MATATSAPSATSTLTSAPNTVINFATDPQLAVREQGLPSPPLPPVDPDNREQLPPGSGQWVVPNFLQSVGLVGMGWRAHGPASDAALKHSRTNAAAMLDDCLILTELERRLRSCSQLPWHLEALDESDNAQVIAAAKNTLAISKTHKLQDALYALNFGKWWGKSAISLLWEWDAYQPDMLRVRDWAPINGNSLVPRYAHNEWGVLVNSMFEGETDGYALGRAHWFTKAEMESVIIHSYNPFQPDFYDALGSGASAGRGLQHGCYWLWYLRANLMALLTDYAERFAAGIWKGKFDESNANARADLEAAVAAYKSKHLLSLPQRRDGSLVCDLEIMEVGTASPAVLQNAIDYIDRLLRAYISGRPSLSGSVGGDEVALQEGHISAVTKADAVCLAEDLTANWLPTLYRYNSPGIPPGRFVFDIDSPNAERLLQYAQAMMEMGWGVNLDHLAKVLGLQPADLNSKVATKIQPLNPTALESPPQQVPVAGNAPQQVTSTAAPAQAVTSQPAGVTP